MAGLNTIFAAGERQLLRQLEAANAAVLLSSLRLSKEQRVLGPVDDPSAFLTLARFQADLNVVGATMNNVTAAESRITQTQSALAQIRTQVQNIRTELAKDENRTLSAAQRAAAQVVIDAAIAQIHTLAGSTIDGRRMLDGSANYAVSGRNASQVRALQIYSTLGGGPLEPVKKAQLSYTGNNRYAAADANITIIGNRGSMTLAVSTTDTLEAIAGSINGETSSTGVVASVSDNTLMLTSQTAGSSSKAQVRVNAGTFLTAAAVAIAGGRTGSAASLSGQVVQTGTQAELLYAGSGGQTTAAATFALSGRLGASTIAVGLAENLTGVRRRSWKRSTTSVPRPA
jgi:flagellin-like hook-associated protein FlgL